jgi:hypothetical protein
MLRPIALTISPDGSLVVADGRRNAIRVHDTRGNLVRWWDRQGSVAQCDPMVPFAVTLDELRGRIQVGWHCYADRRLQPRGFYLETRPVGGGPATLFEQVGVVGATDLDVHPTSGELYVLGPRAVYRLDGGGNIRGQVELAPTGGVPLRIAVLDDGTAAVVRSAFQFSRDGSFLGYEWVFNVYQQVGPSLLYDPRREFPACSQMMGSTRCVLTWMVRRMDTFMFIRPMHPLDWYPTPGHRAFIGGCYGTTMRSSIGSLTNWRL